jgi:hypothetical protein
MTIDETTIQERQSSTSVERSEPCPEFDPAKYRAELAGLGLTKKQEDELLGILWSIMYSFVQLGFDVKNCGQIFESFTQAAQGDSEAVDSSHSTTTETPSPRKGVTSQP